MRIRDIAFAVPSHRVSSQEVAAWAGMEMAFIQEKVGVAVRAFLGRDETTSALAKAACEKLFERNPTLTKDRVQLLVLVTQNPDYKLPHTSALLQASLGLDRGCASFDVSLGCSGYVYGLSVVRGFMAAEELENAILVTCDPYSKVIGKTDRETIALFGDGATATWLSSEKGARIGRLDAGTDGSGAQSLIVPAGGSAKPIHSVWSEEDEVYQSTDFRIHMSGRAIFNFMMERVDASVARCLEKNGKATGEIDYFVFHQASRFLLETLRRKMKLPEQKVPINIEEIGNTVSSTIPIILSGLLDRNALVGKTVLVCGFGVGLSWATNILFFGDNR